MTYVRVSVRIRAPRDQVWAAVRDIASHVDWMRDAESIRFTSDRHEGVGTTFECLTKIGPVRLVDRMEVTEWGEGWVMGIRHVGKVTGIGRFTLEPARVGRHTVFRWEETLQFPWWLAGRLGASIARPVLTLVWRGNLKRLKRSIEGPSRRERVRAAIRERRERRSPEG